MSNDQQCDFPLDPERRKTERCQNSGYTEVVIQDKETGLLYHMLWFCKEHTTTKKKLLIASGENHDEESYNNI